ncbi:MAG: glycosyltransferase [Bdellovibrionota bacterium]
MKILFINRPKFDYLQDFLFTGLTKILEQEAIIEHPWNPKYHLNFKSYPKNIGRIKGGIIGSYLRSLRTFNVDLVILGNCHRDSAILYKNLLDEIPDSVPRIFVDGGDRPEVGGDFFRLGGRDVFEDIIKKRPFDMVFKREMLKGQEYADNVFPMPMCFNPQLTPEISKNKKYDVAFWAVESHPIRTSVLEKLESLFDCKQNGTVKNQVMSKYKRKGEFYLQELASCKIALNFRGAGWDTLRYWEVPAVGGFMLGQEPGILIPNNFEHGKHTIFCKEDLSDLVDLCEFYLENEEEREKIALAGKKHLLEFHTDSARAKYLLGKVQTGMK